MEKIPRMQDINRIAKWIKNHPAYSDIMDILEKQREVISKRNKQIKHLKAQVKKLLEEKEEVEGGFAVFAKSKETVR